MRLDRRVLALSYLTHSVTVDSQLATPKKKELLRPRVLLGTRLLIDVKQTRSSLGTVTRLDRANRPIDPQQQERDSASADVVFFDKVARENAAIRLSDQRCEQYNQL